MDEMSRTGKIYLNVIMLSPKSYELWISSKQFLSIEGPCSKLYYHKSDLSSIDIEIQ